MKGQRGFTLIELLCALTILAAVLAVSLRIMTGSTRTAAAADDYGRALTLATARLAELEAGARVFPGERAGSEDGLEWRDSVRRAEGPAFADAEPLKLIAWRLRCTVRTASGHEVTLTSVRLERLS